jgi:hypothetical protein
MKPYIYLRGLRHAEHTVFAVNDGQKYYNDPVFKSENGYPLRMAYSSGQQVKRSIIESFTSELNVPFAAITFNWEIKGNTAEMKQPFHPCDPTYVDQLIGGYMKSESDNVTIKRRSPLSISAMRPLHPLLGGLESQKEAANFDRKGFPSEYKTKETEFSKEGSNNVRVYKVESKKQIELGKEELDAWLTSNNRQLSAHYYKPDSQTRATGLFAYDIAIDLRTLFCVSTNKLEPELFPNIEEKLRAEGWIDGKNLFGKCLICPKDRRDAIIPALAHAIINWRITSNQARTFSLMETVALAISDNANQIAYAIRGELRDDTDKQQAVPKIDETSTAALFITPIASSYIAGSIGAANALDKAEAKLIELMTAFDYENQV